MTNGAYLLLFAALVLAAAYSAFRFGLERRGGWLACVGLAGVLSLCSLALAFAHG